MEITIQFGEEAIPRPYSSLSGIQDTGALLEFYGTVRGSENGAPIKGLRYELYESMAECEIRRILTELQSHSPCQAVTVVHRHGVVPVGESAIYVGILSEHRHEAFTLLSRFMDRMKQDVPIWKTEVLR